MAVNEAISGTAGNIHLYGIINFGTDDEGADDDDSNDDNPPTVRVPFGATFNERNGRPDVAVCLNAQTRVGKDTPNLRITKVTTKEFYVRFDQVIINGSRRGDAFHYPEDVGWIAVGTIPETEEPPDGS